MGVELLTHRANTGLPSLPLLQLQVELLLWFQCGLRRERAQWGPNPTPDDGDRVGKFACRLITSSRVAGVEDTYWIQS